MLFCCEAKTQTDLVPDYSFEDTITCPYAGLSINFSSPNWYTTPGFGTADHFCSCSNKDSIALLGATAGVPYNVMGKQYAKEGLCYAGIFAFYGDFLFKEYLTVKLNTPLTQGVKYKISFNISLADSCIYAVKNMGVLFTQSAFNQGSLGVPNLLPQIKVTSSGFYGDKTNWVLVSDSNYVADGNEYYLTIGNFETVSSDTITLQFPHAFIPGINNEYRSAYYFIDDVQIIEKENPILIPNIFTPNKDGKNDLWFVNCKEECSLTIHNRWGLKIKETKQKVLSWDGTTTSGEECSDGIYYYIIETKDKRYNGFIQLIR